MRVLKCISCDLLLHDIPISLGYSMCCPQCGTRVNKQSSLPFPGELATSLAALALFFPAQMLVLISIDLFGVNLSATVSSGSLILMPSFPFVSALVLFSTTLMPLFYLLSILTAHLALSFHHAKMLSVSTHIISLAKHWVMIDVFLVSLAVGSFKVRELADISVGPGLLSLILLQVLLAILLSYVSPERYWNKYSQRESVSRESLRIDTKNLKNNQIVTCKHCELTQQSDKCRCIRCGTKLEFRFFQSLQKTWASLLAAIIFIFPANLFPISILLSNGKRFEDTIFSGVAALIKQGMYGIAIIIFTASIIVPVAKIISLLYILICIQLKVDTGKKERMRLYRFVRWISKWSMMDLCVISIMVSLLDRGNLLDFTPGPGAIAFGLVVLLTIIAAESLDSRLIWEKHEEH